MINKVLLIGNLGGAPEVKYLEGNVAVAKFSIATNESYKDKKGDWQTATEWHNIIAWRMLAEKCEKQLSKGAQVYVEGKLTHRKYQDKDGIDRYVTEVVANNVRLLGGSSKPQSGDEREAAPSPTADDSGSSYDDLPF